MTLTTAPTTPAAGGLSALVESHVAGRMLPAPLYLGQEAYDLDLRAVWTSTWVFVATEAEVREAGDFVCLDVGPYPIIVVRDDDDRVRALHNVCRHRASRVLTEPAGSTGTLVCGYHQWTYATDGSLLHAGQQAPGFDPSCLGLKQIHVRTLAGLIYLCLADEPPADFDDMAERVAPYLAAHQLRRTRVAAQEDLVEAGNWKLVMENNRECYHCEAGHPELTCTFFPTYGYAPEDIPDRLLPAHARYLRSEGQLERACRERGIPYEEIEELSGRPTAFRVQREPLDGAGESYTMDGAAASRRLLGELDTPGLGRLSLHHQPNAWFHFCADHAVAFAVLPLGPDRTLVRSTWLVHEDAVAGVDYDLDGLTEVWRATNAQDSVFVARAHEGVSSPAYEPGPYAPSEYQVDAFDTWYLERVRDHLGTR